MKNPTFLAHVRQIPGTNEWQEHTLAEHSLAVAELAKKFGTEFGSGDIAWLLGLYHDLGKATPDFQHYIRQSSGYQKHISYAIIAPREKRHAITGALYIIERLAREAGCSILRLMREPLGHLLMHPIAGHHAGLPDWNTPGDNGSLQQQMTDYKFLLSKLSWEQPEFPREFNEANLKEINLKSLRKMGNQVLFGRFLFSSLVDADFLDTEQFFDAEQSQLRKCSITLPQLRDKIEHYLLELAQSADTKKSPLSSLRESILSQCRMMSGQAPGLFSLTVPTGGGKTLSSMMFALNHAITHGKRRIIYVIPYTSIIEQTASVFRKAFGDLAPAVLEHHSNLDSTSSDLSELDENLGQIGYNADKANNRLATENWDWPVIVTTNVQFFESLFSAKPSRCRKLHNITNSVVVFDEAQMLPPDFLGPVCQTIQELTDCYGVTAVLMTATQPALSAENFQANPVCKGLRNVREIIDNPKMLAQRFQGRVTLSLPDDLNAEISIDDLANRLSVQTLESWLCIVNTRSAARALYQRMCETGSGEGLFHLSTQLCGKHRKRVLNEIRARLSRNEITQVISTQLVEAGVDLDFPRVYRALSGLDSLAQAAGRCNRENRLADPGGVEVFVLEKNSPRGHLQQTEAICRQLLQECKKLEREPLSLWAFERYFQELFWSKGSALDKKGIAHSEAEWAYRTVARDFQMIPDAGVNLIVPYDETAKALILEIQEAKRPDFRWRRRAQPYIVTIPEPVMNQALLEGMVVCKFEDLHLVLPDSPYYDERLGFLPPGNIIQRTLDNMLYL